MDLVDVLATDSTLPSLPRVLALLTTELAQPEPNLRRVNRWFCGDPVLAARLLQEANAQSHPLSGKVGSIAEAMVLLDTAQLRLFAGTAYRPRLLVFSRAVHLVLLQLLVRVCAQLLPGSVTACSTLAARVLPVFRLPPDAAAAGFVFLCAALYKARQSLYNTL